MDCLDAWPPEALIEHEPTGIVVAVLDRPWLEKRRPGGIPTSTIRRSHD